MPLGSVNGKYGAWVQDEKLYNTWCSECGADECYREHFVKNQTIDTALASACCGGYNRDRCIFCDSVNLTTKSPTIARMIRYFLEQMRTGTNERN